MRPTPGALWDRLIFISLCPLVYFLPISIALVETFASLAIFFYLVKRLVILENDRRRTGPLKHVGLETKRFFLALTPAPTPINRLLLAFVAVNFLTVIFSQNLLLSLQGFFFKLAEQVLLFCAVLEGVRTPKRAGILLIVCLAAAGLMGADGIFQFAVGKDFIHHYAMVDPGRVQASFKQSNDFGTYVAFMIFVVWSVLITSGRFFISTKFFKPEAMKKSLVSEILLRILALEILAALIIVLGLTYSRGAWIGFAAGMLFFACTERKRFFLSLLVGMAITLVFFIHFYAARPTAKFYPAAVARNASASAGEKILDSVQTVVGDNMGRFAYWQEALRIIRDYPVLGTGINTYTQEGRKYKLAWGGYPHNCYLQMCAETGIIGLLAFLALIYGVYHFSLKQLRAVKDDFWKSVVLGLLAAVLAFLTHGFFDTNFYSVRLSLLPWIGMGMIFGILGSQADSVAAKPASRR